MRRRRARPSRWAVFAVGIVCQIVFSAAFLGLPAASTVVQRRYELSAMELAVLLGAASLAVVLTEAPWGVAADRIGERRVLLLGIGTSSLMLVSAGVFSVLIPHPSVLALAVLIFIAAAAGGAVTGPSGSAILGWFDARRHGTLVALRVAAVPLGGALGTVAYSGLFTVFGVGPAFLVMGLACALTGVLVLKFAFDPPSRKHSGRVASPLGEAIRDPRIQRVATSGFMLDVTQFLVLTFAATVLNELYGVPLAAGLFAVAAMQLVGGALRVAIGVGTDFIPWLRRPLVVRVLCAVQAVCLMPFVVGTTLPPGLPLVLLCVAGIAGCAWQGAHFAHIAELAGPSAAGTALGLNNAATSFGAFVAQVATGGVAIALGWPVTFVVLGVAPALIAMAIFPRDRQSAGELG